MLASYLSEPSLRADLLDGASKSSDVSGRSSGRRRARQVMHCTRVSQQPGNVFTVYVIPLCKSAHRGGQLPLGRLPLTLRPGWGGGAARAQTAGLPLQCRRQEGRCRLGRLHLYYPAGTLAKRPDERPARERQRAKSRGAQCGRLHSDGATKRRHNIYFMVFVLMNTVSRQPRLAREASGSRERRGPAACCHARRYRQAPSPSNSLTE